MFREDSRGLGSINQRDIKVVASSKLGLDNRSTRGLAPTAFTRRNMSTGERDRDLYIETKDQFKRYETYLTRTDASRLTSPVQGVPKQKRETSPSICIENVASRPTARSRTTYFGCRVTSLFLESSRANIPREVEFT